MVAEGAVSPTTGAFALNVATVPDQYTLLVTAEGYQTAREELSVPDDQRLNVKIGLLAGTSTEMPTVEVKFSSPANGLSTEASSVVVKGTVTGLDLASVKVNGLPSKLTGNGFSVEIPLADGVNTIEAVATGKNGNVAKASIKVTRGSAAVTQPRTGCSALGFSELQLIALLALLPTLRRRRT